MVTEVPKSKEFGVLPLDLNYDANSILCSSLLSSLPNSWHVAHGLDSLVHPKENWSVHTLM